MARKKPMPEPPDPRVAPFFGLTPNQVVAYNLALARADKGWTQDQAAAAMAPYLGVRWSKASVSQAERSVAGGVVRNFTADEIVAFARTYEVPVTWFFMPPPPVVAPGVAARLAVPDAPGSGESVALLVDLVFGDRVQQAGLALRVERFLAEPSAALTAAQAQIVALADQRVAALVQSAFVELGHWQSRLRALANRLEDLEAVSKTTLARDLDVDPADLRLPPRQAAEAGGAWDDDPVAAFLRTLDEAATGEGHDDAPGDAKAAAPGRPAKTARAAKKSTRTRRKA